MAIAGIAVIVIAAGVVVASRGDPTGTLAGACCGVGGVLLVAIALLGRRALRARVLPAAPASAAPPAEPEYVCGKCGADLAPGATVCEKCGEPVED